MYVSSQPNEVIQKICRNVGADGMQLEGTPEECDEIRRRIADRHPGDGAFEDAFTTLIHSVLIVMCREARKKWEISERFAIHTVMNEN